MFNICTVFFNRRVRRVFRKERRESTTSLRGTKQSIVNSNNSSGLLHRSFLTLRNDVIGLYYIQL